MVSSLVILALASAAAALQVSSPSKSSVWTVGEDQTVTWDAVSTDEDTFSIYLSNQVEYPPVSTLLVSDVSKSAGSAKIDGSKLAAGDSFTINFTNGDKTEQIYAQSNQFNITEGSTSSSSASASSTSSSSATSTSSSGTATTSATTLASVTSASSSGSASVTTGGASTASVSAGANTRNGTATGSSTTTATGTSSTASASGSASASGTASGTGANASSTSTTTSGAGKIVAGWMVMVAAAAMAL